MLSPEEVQKILAFDRFYEEHLAGKISRPEFEKARTLYGVHSIRDRDTVMLRVRIPGGEIYSEQALVLADLAQRWCPDGEFHLTTRQNIQFYDLPMEKVGQLLKELARVGLSTISAGGRGTRTVTVTWSPEQGEAEFDVLPFVRYLDARLRMNTMLGDLPAKFKIAVAESSQEDLRTDSHDLGLYPVHRSDAKDGSWGFKIKVGGGLGRDPRRAKTLIPFVPQHQAVAWVMGVLDWFKDQPPQRPGRNRLKYLLEQADMDELAKEVSSRASKFSGDGVDALPSLPKAAPSAHKQGSQVEFESWRERDVVGKGNECCVRVHGRLGFVPAMNLATAAGTAEHCGCRTLRIDNHQQMWITNIPEANLYEAWESLGKPEGRSAPSVVSCPGPKYCRLGQLQSRALAEAIETKLGDWKGKYPSVLRVSGCKNGCGQHALSPFAWHGEIAQVDKKPSPQFWLFAGANRDRHATPLVRVPARQVPEATRRLLDWYNEKGSQGESPSVFFSKLSPGRCWDLLEDLISGTKATEEIFKDNGREDTFSPARVEASQCA